MTPDILPIHDHLNHPPRELVARIIRPGALTPLALDMKSNDFVCKGV